MQRRHVHEEGKSRGVWRMRRSLRNLLTAAEQILVTGVYLMQVHVYVLALGGVGEDSGAEVPVYSNPTQH